MMYHGIIIDVLSAYKCLYHIPRTHLTHTSRGEYRAIPLEAPLYVAPRPSGVTASSTSPVPKVNRAFGIGIRKRKGRLFHVLFMLLFDVFRAFSFCLGAFWRALALFSWFGTDPSRLVSRPSLVDS